MSILVQKYGGTSVGTVERIEEVARRVARRHDKTKHIIVVVSAMVGETDRLISLARAISPDPVPRELDVLLSSGEQVSAALLAMALNKLGRDTCSFLSFQLPIRTKGNHVAARIREIETEKIRRVLDEGKIVVIAGFQGIDEQGDITTLGRGGSDTTAVALAAALGAKCCEIYTDVDGVYTCDPQLHFAARKLAKISYEEMLELSGLGAKVLHSRCVELAMKYGVRLLVCSSFNNEKGTWVDKEGETMEGALISGVTSSKGEAKLSILGVPDRPGIVHQIFAPLAESGINVDMIVQNISRKNSSDVTFTVPSVELARTLEIVKKIAGELGAEGTLADKNIAKVSIVGAGMKSHPGVASKMFGALAAEGINIQMISTSEIKISCVIEAKYAELAVRVLHDVFELGEKGKGDASDGAA